MIKDLGNYLKKNFTVGMRKSIEFIDFGGGFFPTRTEGYYPWTTHYPWNIPAGTKKTSFADPYYITETLELSEYAEAIAEAIKAYIEPIVKCIYYAEPGRIICNNAMHIVVQVQDNKAPGNVITDGGVNIVGWEYGEHFYFPLVNLTHPSLKEIKCTLYCPLCTPHDIWGYYCYASKMKEGDVVVVPNQGAYRYSLAQNFIKPIPEVRVLES